MDQLGQIGDRPLKTFVPRANTKSDPLGGAVPRSALLDNASISRTEHDRLLDVARRYENICEHLRGRGYTEAKITALSLTSPSEWKDGPPPNPSSRQNGSSFKWPAPDSKHPGHANNQLSGSDSVDDYNDFAVDDNGLRIVSDTFTTSSDASHGVDQSDYAITGTSPVFWTLKTGPQNPETLRELKARAGTRTITPPQSVLIQRSARRTVFIWNLPDGAKHADLTAVIRGGPLVDIYVRYGHSATVSFVHASHAAAFLAHALEHGLVVKQTNVSVRWADHHYKVPGFMGSKISHGTTRNLVIRPCQGITESSIREDLEHINNIVIIKIEFVGNNCHVSLNSIQNAIYARSCLLSRKKYKGSRVECYSDECARPLPSAAIKSAVPEMTNRFQLLNSDDD